MKKIAIITGGSRGIGAATARLLAERGYDLCISYRQREETAEALAEELRTYSVNAIAVRADISVESDIERLFREVDARLGPLTALVNAPNEYIDYASTKGAVDTLTIGLSKEVADEGIRVNGVRPGFIDTDMHADGGEPDRIERVKANIPLGRGGRPEEVGAAIAWLLSDEASYVTGSLIDIAGGR